MPEQNESGEKAAGRLYATLRVLRFLAGADIPRPTAEDAFTEKDRPRDRIRALKADPFEDLVSAVRRGRHAKEAGEVFRTLTTVIPAQETALEKNLGERGLADFNAGYRAQLAKLGEMVPGVLD